MKDKTGFDGELAFVMRPIPSTMATDEQEVVIGGLPRLPADLDWPRQADGTPTHFFAEIDLSRLPRESEGHRTPDFPEQGTLFVFIPFGHDGFHRKHVAKVLYSKDSVTDLPERQPPDDLPGFREAGEPLYMHPDGTTHYDRVILRRHVDVLPFFSPLLTHPCPSQPWTGGEEERQRMLDDHKERWNLHHKNIADTLRTARPIGSPLGEHIAERQRAVALPFRFRRNQAEFDIAVLDWKFVHDWGAFFYRRCLRRTHKEMRKAETTWLTKWFQPRALRRIERLRDDFERLVLDFDALSHGATEGGALPPGASEPFDVQAKEWVALALAFNGRLPPHMLEAFLNMLAEIDRRAEQRTADGKHLPAGIDMLESAVGGSSFNAATTATYAADAFAHAVETEPERFSPIRRRPATRGSLGFEAPELRCLQYGRAGSGSCGPGNNTLADVWARRCRSKRS